MKTRIKPVKRSVFLFTLGFIILLCLVLSLITYTSYSNSLYNSYNLRMVDILHHVVSHIDLDELRSCVENYEETEEYYDLMEYMDGIMDDFDIHYLYIMAPDPTADKDIMMNVLSADTTQGRIEDPDGYHIGTVLYDAYSDEDMARYFEAYEANTITYFKNFSIWGYDYTAAMPLFATDGEKYALLCVDIEVKDLQVAISTYTMINIILIILMGMFFIVVFLTWMSRNVIDPIRSLEKNVSDFALRSHDQKDPDLLYYDAPDIRCRNEVESLSHAITQMTNDMRAYVKNLLGAKSMVEDMKSEVSRMDTLAHQDALTHVKNKAWYDQVAERVDADIADGKARFGIIMTDLNNLKYINDNYGHERGNDYIRGACHEICVVFDHSPVFRVGGDEFVVLLENRDYNDRESLVVELREKFKKMSNDESRRPWERYSAAIGVAIYDSGTDKSMNEVLDRADWMMYDDKFKSKKGRK